MNFPAAHPPGMMITFFAEPADRRSNVAVRFIVLVVPQQKSGHANFVRLAAGRDETVVGQSKERGQFLNPHATAIKRRLSVRSDFANDRRWIADLRRMIRRRG